MIENLKNNPGFDFSLTKFVGYDSLSTTATVVGIFDEHYQKSESLAGHGYLCFDQTVFYAVSGGQASDQGVIHINGVEFEVIDVRKDLVYGYYIHEVNLKDQAIKVGDVVELVVNPTWRKYASINHSSLHIVWQTTLRHVGHYVNEVMSKLDRDKYQLQFEPDPKITPELIWNVTNEFNNKIIPQDVEANIFLVSQQEAVEKKYLYEFTKITGDEMVRMVEFPGIVIEPCSGTHIHSTKEVGQTWFLDYDANSKRIFIEMTSNPDYANKYFTEKLINRFEEIKQIILKGKKNGVEQNFDNYLEKGQNLLTTWNYFSIKEINTIYDEVAMIVNKAIKENEKELLAKIKSLNLEFEQVNNFLITKTNNDLYTNKTFLPKISQHSVLEPEKVIVFLNQTSNGANLILMRNKNYDFNLKPMMAKILETTSFKGGGNDSMIQMVSTNHDDIQKVINLFQ